MHLYHQDGKPCYKVPYADPKRGMRKSTLADAKKLNLLPSVTTVLNILDKPGLNNWLQDRVLESALTLPRRKEESDKSYMLRIKQDSKEISTLARDEGTRIHNALESGFNGQKYDSRYSRVVDRTMQATYKYFNQYSGWMAEQSFAHKLGYAGKVDLRNFAKIPQSCVVVDFKTKEELKPKMAFDEQCMQLVAYAHGLNMPNARLVNIFVNYDGETVFHEWDELEKERCWNMFKACLELWKLQKRYNPVIKVAA